MNHAELRVQILLVDDRPENLTALRAVLEAPGEHIVCAGSGAEALALLQQQEFACVLLDVRMPEMDGFETASRIRASDRFPNTPILFLTAAEAEPAHLARAYALGAVDVLSKPLDLAALRAKVGTFVQLKREALQRRAAEDAEGRLLLLAEASDRLLRSLDVPATLPALLELSRRLVPADAYAVWRARADGGWDAVVDHGLSPGYPRTLPAHSGGVIPGA
ncbi:MAG TPA: response regulator, partial [Armatimonadota bacterium]|nr:response regulator [Armatimonadota bacterium]